MTWSKNTAGPGLVLLALAFLLTTPCLAQKPPEEPSTPPEEAPVEEPVSPPVDEPKLMVTATICTDVVNREPAGAGQMFPASVEKLYCYTLVEGAQEPTTITHIWYHGEQNMAEVYLEVNSSRWRTWSSKKILENWTGNWHVDVLDEAGASLATITFTVQ